jgi:hypothetical protein
VDRVGSSHSSRVGGAICSEVAVDLYTTKILKADVTVVDYSVLGGEHWLIQCGIRQRDTPDISWTGDVVKCKDGTWVCVCEVIPNIWGVLVFAF